MYVYPKNWHKFAKKKLLLSSGNFAIRIEHIYLQAKNMTLALCKCNNYVLLENEKQEKMLILGEHGDLCMSLWFKYQIDNADSD